MNQNVPRRATGSKDLSGWVVAGLFMLFLSSMVVYRVALLSVPPQEETIAESPRTPLPAGPRRYNDAGQ